MAEISVSAKAPKVDKEATINYNFGGNCDEAVKLFGAEVVYSGFVQNSVVTLQGAMRGRMTKGGDVAALSAVWKPGVKLQAVAVDPREAAIAAFGSMSKENKAKFISDLKAA